jgi:hypothetical protein
MKRVLLLPPTTGYRNPDFLAAANKLGVEIVAVADYCHQLAPSWGLAPIMALHFDLTLPRFDVLQFSLLPDALYTVLAENRVCRDDWQFLLKGLRNQQAVKGVAVMRTERFNAPHMRHPDIQYQETVGRDMFDNVALHGEGKFQLAQAGLDRQLPYTDEA